MQMHDRHPAQRQSISSAQHFGLPIAKDLVVQNTNLASAYACSTPKLIFRRLGLAVRDAVRSNIQLLEKVFIYPPASIARGRIDGDHFDAFIVLID